MAPSVGHLHKMVAKNVKLVKYIWKQSTRAVQNAVRPIQAELQPAYATNNRTPKHPIALLKQSKRRAYSTQTTINARQYTTRSSAPSGVKYDRSSFPKSRIGTAVVSSTGRAPFASTLRPNLTGGALNRTSGGYAFGAGHSARYFSHSPATPAHVVQNVSQAVRAFLISGQMAHFDGVDPKTGVKRFKACSALQEETGQKIRSLPRATPGSFVDFKVNPTITALTPMTAVAGFARPGKTLNAEGLLDVLSVDFSRALKDLAAILNDLTRLSSLGDLPITYQDSSLRIHFPGCDSETVESLCLELGIQRGLVGQDEDFDTFVGTEIALLFPFAPSNVVSECSVYNHSPHHPHRQEKIEWENMLSPDIGDRYPADLSARSDTGSFFEGVGGDAWMMSPSAYDTLHSSEVELLQDHYDLPSYHDPLEYQGFEGIYRFIEQCDAARRR